MKQSTKTWLVTIAVFLLYVAIAIAVALGLKLHGWVLWLVVVALVVAGGISAWLIYRFMRGPVAPKVAYEAGSPEAILAAAGAQLVAARHVTNPRFGALPVLLVFGPDASAKTTTIVRSGLEPELLAGDVFRGETVAPTSAINAWYSNNTVIVEAGGRFVQDAPAWKKLVHALAPRSLASALTGKPQPPRLAVVCFGCDEFYKPGAGESVPEAARVLRARLGEAAKAFGVQLPTYVVFTKLDAVAYFDAYARNLSAEEAKEPLGAGVLPDAGGAGTYADRMTPGLERAFDALYASLAERRVLALGREHAAEFKPGAYEFPREFAKLKALAVDFVRELGRPSELEVSPVLRGFYFTGVQAVFVSAVEQERAAVAAAAPKPQAAARSATAVFTPPVVGAAAPVAAPVAQGGTRKVPRWDFLPRLLREAVFGDQAAVTLTAAGARVSFLRRLGLGAAAVLALILGVAFTISYSGNDKLATAAVEATRGIASLAPNPVDLPPQTALERLDALRQQVDTLSAYEHTGAPLSLRWGLYAGHSLYTDVSDAYFGGFDKLMFAATRNGMRTTLASLPDTVAPTDDYGATYSLLKAYIITTAHPEKSTVDFLPAVLYERWRAGRSIDSARAQLARKQFETYASELRYGNPLPDSADVQAVAKGRAFLRGFAGSERIYQFILSEAAKTNPAIQFNRNVPGSAAYVVDGYEVPGAFTKGGATFVAAAFKTVDKYLTGEAWVVGDDAGQVDKAKLVAELKSRYAIDYIDHWRRFLATAQVARYAGVKDAAAKLAVISGNASPLLSLFATASQNTAPDAFPDVTKAFQAVQTVVPPTVTDKLIGDKNKPYIDALLPLQSSLDQAANGMGGAATAAVAQASSNAAQAKSAVLSIANGFTPDATTHIPDLVQQLLLQPIANADPMLRNFGANEVNVRSRALCAVVGPLLRKYPFTTDATTQATLSEVADVFRPQTGKLWQFYDDALASILPLQGAQYAQAGGNVKIVPGFVTLMTRARAFSEALFKDENSDPKLTIPVEPKPDESFRKVTLDLDGIVIESAFNGNSGQARVPWPGQAHQASLSATVGGQQMTTIAGPYTGPWATFQLFNRADDWKPSGDGFRVGWEVRSGTQRLLTQNGVALQVAVQVDVPQNVANILRKNFFAGAECGGDIAR